MADLRILGDCQCPTWVLIGQVVLKVRNETMHWLHNSDTTVKYQFTRLPERFAETTLNWLTRALIESFPTYPSRSPCLPCNDNQWCPAITITWPNRFEPVDNIVNLMDSFSDHMHSMCAVPNHDKFTPVLYIVLLSSKWVHNLGVICVYNETCWASWHVDYTAWLYWIFTYVQWITQWLLTSKIVKLSGKTEVRKEW